MIENAAREPEVEDLAVFLNGHGRPDQGAGTNRIVIQGVERLQAASTRSSRTESRPAPSWWRRR